MQGASGDRFGDFTLIEHVARGSSSDVWRADDGMGGSVAIKLVERSADHRTEVQALQAVAHESIVELVDAGAGPPVHWLATRWCDGEPLAATMHGRPRGLDDVAEVLAPVAAALDALHEAGWVHGDLNPRNIIVRDPGSSGPRAVLIDLGSARPAGGAEPIDVTTDLGTATTPRYCAPEVAAGAAPQPASDRYALAVLAYELATGAAPFPEVEISVAMLAHHASTEPTPPSEVNPAAAGAAETALLAGLAKAPTARPTTATFFVDALRGRRTLPAPSRRSPSRAEVTGRRVPTRLLVGAGVVALLAAIVGFALRASSDDTGSAPAEIRTDEPSRSEPSLSEPALSEPSSADDGPASATVETAASATPPTAPPAPTAPAPTASPAEAPAAPPDEVLPAVGAWPAGTAAGQLCNLLEAPGFEADPLPEGWYTGDVENTIAVVPGAGIDGSAALRIGSTGAYGLYAELVPVDGATTYVFESWIRRQGEPAEAALYINFVDADFTEITSVVGPPLGPAGVVGDEFGTRVRIEATAPAAAAWAIPTYFKDGSGGSMLVDEAVFGSVDACTAVPG